MSQLSPRSELIATMEPSAAEESIRLVSPGPSIQHPPFVPGGNAGGDGPAPIAVPA